MYDNTIIPSYLREGERGVKPSFDNINSLGFRVGEIKQIVYPTDTNSISHKFVEYSVEVVLKDGDSPYSTTLFHGCIISTLFGGFADRFTYTLRTDDANQKNDNNVGIGIGSKVLLLCLNGNMSNAVIIGGLTDFESGKVTDKKEDGHNLYFEFNGCNFSINKDGEIALKFRGATKSNGELADSATPEAEGTSLKITKDGSMTLSTPEDNQFIKIDHANKKLEIQAQSEWNSVIKGSVLVQADSNVSIKSAGVLVGAATDAWVKGTTYRQSESIMNSVLGSNMIAASALMTTAGANILAASPLNAIPVVGGLLSAPFWVLAGTAITSAAPLLSVMGAAINSFEGGAVSYLSQKNRGD